MAGVRRAVPARSLVDAGARPAALRLRGAGGARAGDRPRGAAHRHPRDARPRGAAADDGRRQRRRLPLRRARLVAGGGDRVADRKRARPAAQTFAVGTEASPDLAAARTVAEHLGCDHVEVTYTAAGALESLPNVVRAIESFDPGLVRSAVPNYILARTTRRHVKVVLTGEGADKRFAGYDYMREFTDDDALHAELERTGALAPQPQPAALRPRDDGPRGRGAGAVPGPQRDRLGAADPAGGKQGMPEKRLLREAFTGWLPDELLWRAKAEFGDGSGARDVLSEEVEATVSHAEFEAERGAVEPALRTKEEDAYYPVWREHLQGISPERTLSRFARARRAPANGKLRH